MLINGTRVSIILIILIFLSAGCIKEEAVPTLAPTAQIPTLIPSSSPSLVPTNTAVAPISVEPTVVEPTLAPTNTPTPVVSTREPTPLPPSGVNITFPDEGAEFTLGEELVTGGRAQLNMTEFISVTLLSANGVQLDQIRVEANEINNWQAALTIPQSITGQAYLRATVSDQENMVKSSDELAIVLRLADEPDGRAIDLYRPSSGDQVVNGYYMLFDGRVEQPVNNLVSVSLWNEECQQQAAVESFRVNGSGDWWGLLFVPTNLSGRVCVAARFGTPGDSEWRESQRVIEVLPGGDSRSNGVVIAIPRADAEIESGRSITIEGLAHNAPDRLVTVSVLLDNGRLLTEGVTGVDRYGYWDLSLFIPADAEGSAHIAASIGSRGDENYSEITSPINIDGGS